MKKTNIMVEVSDELYESIVAPYKKRKSFGKLVVQLLEAYSENDSIYSYINGALDGMEDKATEELLRDLNNMSQSLSMLNMLGSQAESVIDNGKRDFEDIWGKEVGRSSFEEEVKEKEEIVKVPQVAPITREDVQNIVNESMLDIKSMLKEILTSGVVFSESHESPVIHTHVESSGYREDTADIDIVEKSEVKEVIEEQGKFGNSDKNYIDSDMFGSGREEEEDTSSEDESMAQDALGSLMASIGSF